MELVHSTWAWRRHPKYPDVFRCPFCTNWNTSDLNKPPRIQMTDVSPMLKYSYFCNTCSYNDLIIYNTAEQVNYHWDWTSDQR